MITCKNYIGGELSSNSSVSFKTFNPILNIENNITEEFEDSSPPI